MNADTLKLYGPCPTHQLWHDLERQCFYCVVERAAITDTGLIASVYREEGQGHAE